MQKKISFWIKKKGEKKQRHKELRRNVEHENSCWNFVEIYANVNNIQRKNFVFKIVVARSIFDRKLFCDLSLESLLFKYSIICPLSKVFWSIRLPTNSTLPKIPVFFSLSIQLSHLLLFLLIKVVIVCFIKFFAYSFFLDFQWRSQTFFKVE